MRYFLLILATMFMIGCDNTVTNSQNSYKNYGIDTMNCSNFGDFWYGRAEQSFTQEDLDNGNIHRYKVKRDSIIKACGILFKIDTLDNPPDTMYTYWDSTYRHRLIVLSSESN